MSLGIALIRMTALILAKILGGNAIPYAVNPVGNAVLEKIAN